LATNDARRHRIRDRLGAGDTLFAPAHLDVEVASGLRRLARADIEVAQAVPAALANLASIAVHRMPVAPLLERIWALRSNVTAYDAAYVALAELLGVPLVTRDARLAAATGLSCVVELIA
jgi:predicted nucleic acid-binding protein